jgi:multidrug efflux pump subunit AcrB
MLNSIVSWALNMRVLVVAAALALLVVGINATKNAPLDVFPEFAPPLVEVQTEAPGLSTEEVDCARHRAAGELAQRPAFPQNDPLEVGARPFLRGDDLQHGDRHPQGTSARAGAAQSRAKPPARRGEAARAHGAVFLAESCFEGRAHVRRHSSQMELSELAVWTMRPRLMSVSKAWQTWPSGASGTSSSRCSSIRRRLRAAGVTLDAITKAAGDAAVISAGGFIDTPNLRLPSTNSPSSPRRMTSPAPSSSSAMERPSASAMSRRSWIGHPPPIGDAVINDGDGILLIVEKQPWGNTLDVTTGVEKVLADMKPALPGVTIDSTIFRPATFIQLSIDHLTEALWLGCLLVVVVLALFLGDWRTTIISITAIPLSLAIALLLLAWRGETINTMILARPHHRSRRGRG